MLLHLRHDGVKVRLGYSVARRWFVVRCLLHHLFVVLRALIRQDQRQSRGYAIRRLVVIQPCDTLSAATDIDYPTVHKLLHSGATGYVHRLVLYTCTGDGKYATCIPMGP